MLCDTIFCGFLIVDFILFVVMRQKAKRNHNLPHMELKRHPNYAVVIPARDESKVIGGLLKSLQEQTYELPMEQVFIIVETKEDPTVLIAKQYGATVLYRKHLDLKRKGYALNEGIEQILDSGYSFDAYVIFDADNILDRNFLKEMTRTVQAGYDIGIGYRNCKNGNDSVIAASSSLTFSMINTLGNDQKNRESRNMVISGTGFYIKGEWIEKWGGYPFHSLTEDYELTLYATLHNMTVCYNKKVLFYDEQPTTYQVSKIQRTRWIKGFLTCRRKYGKMLRAAARKKGPNSGSQFVEGLGITPVLIAVIGFVISLFYQIYGLLFTEFKTMFLSRLLFSFLFLYLVLFLFTLLLLWIEKNQINLSWSMKLKTLFYNPVFLCSYVSCALRALFQKNIGWQPIEHHAKEVK